MTRANKELAYYQEKADLARKINKMEERRVKKITVEEECSGEGSDGGKRVESKKIKNLKKMIDYHSRKRREFKQREPIPLELEGGEVV